MVRRRWSNTVFVVLRVALQPCLGSLVSTMKTVHQMSLGECRLECERLAQRRNAMEVTMRAAIYELSKPYDNVIDLEIRVIDLVRHLKEELSRDAADSV